ncbi:MAG: hypothetical protein OXT49_10370 [Gammaproteobacteria bacterium]|nr:hypothetical protein [Gammaproteobacteria bacterium]
MLRYGLALAASVLALIGCGKNDIDSAVCEAVGDAKPVCGFHQPEDFALLPDGKTLVVAELGSMFTYARGYLALFNTETEQLKRFELFDQPASEVWVDIDCPGPPGDVFSPHGIHYSQRADGDGQLLVINHGERESVEFFEVVSQQGEYDIEWRGCVSLPENDFANSVVATPEGGFIYSHMFNRDALRFGTTSWPSLKAVLGIPSGHAVEWKGLSVADGRQFETVPGTEAGFPNGVELSADGRYLFMNTSVDGYVHKVDRVAGERVASSEKIPHLDNIRWDQSGRLLAASMPTGLFESVRCLEIAPNNCGGTYNIVRLDPETLAHEVIYSHEGGQPMGAATVGFQVDKHLYIGSYSGNRLVKTPYKP